MTYEAGHIAAFYSCSVASNIKQEDGTKEQKPDAAQIAADENAQINTAIGFLAKYLELSKQDYTLEDFRWNLESGREVKFHLLKPLTKNPKSET